MIREKVLHGLDSCGFHDGIPNICEVTACPYRDNKAYCVHELAHDAGMLISELLKAQEPRVMTLEEVRALQDNTVVWLEDNDKTDVIPAIVNHAWNSLPNIVSFALKNLREVKADMLWYGVKWRCWTSRPTDEQRREILWN